MVFPTAPNSTTGQISLINLASEVPPVVESLGDFPVIFFTEEIKISTNLSGGV